MFFPEDVPARIPEDSQIITLEELTAILATLTGTPLMFLIIWTLPKVNSVTRVRSSLLSRSSGAKFD
jgi:hypothetical protein